MKFWTRIMGWLAGLVLATLAMPGLHAQAWQDLPNTKLQSVCPPNNFQPAGGGMPAYNFADECHYVVDGWNGAVADTRRNRLLIWGGGHVAYHGNEVYSIDLASPSSSSCTGGPCRSNASAPTVTRLNDPSIFSPACPQGIRQPTDDTPIQRHTYGSLVYLPHADKMFAWAGPDYCGGSTGQQYHNVWLFNLANNTWEEHLPGGWDVSGVPPAYGPDSYCLLDPTTTNEAVLCMWGDNTLLRYNVDGAKADTWDLISPYGTWGLQSGGMNVIDPDHKLLFRIGPDYVGTPGSGAIWAVDLTNPTSASNWTSSVAGCSDLIGVPYPGLAWDPTLHKIVGYIQASPSSLTVSNNKIIVFDPVAKTCATQSIPGGPTASYSNLVGGTGTFGRFSYFPALSKYVVVNNYADDAYTLTLNPSSDTTAPTVSVTAPTASASVSGQITISATASDNVGVTSVQFTLDGASLGSPLTAPPYNFVWNTLAASNGSHALSAIALDAAGNRATATAVAVTVSNNPPPSTSVTGINGLGASTFTCIDKDGDKYGVGPGCLGPDADDNDSTIHTGPEAIAKYGTISAFLNHLGYSPNRIFYLAPTTATPPGNNSTGVVNDPTHPFLDWSGVGTRLAAGDAVILRGGVHNFWAMGPLTIGSASAPLILMSYPGELAMFTNRPTGFDLVGATNLIMDGFYFNASGSNAGVQGGDNTNVVIRHIESQGGKWGLVAANLNNFTVEESVFHDNAGPNGGGEHGMYLANRNPSGSLDVFVRRNIFYNNDYNGFQFNGKVNNLIVEQNLSYNNYLSGFSWLSGVSHSIFRSNVAFNNGRAGLTIYNYTDFCVAFDPNNVGTACPYDQNNNLIENFTFYGTGKDRFGVDSSTAQAAIKVTNSSTNKIGDMGHNIFRNIVAAVPGVGNQYQPIVFEDGDKDYLATSTIDHIVFNQLDMGSGAGSTVVGWGVSSNFGFNGFDCATASTVTTITGCINADPKFISASTSFWNSANQFDLRLQSISPAAHTGTSNSAPVYDVLGFGFSSTPSMGAYEVGGSMPAVNPCDLNKDTRVDNADVQTAIAQALGQAACSTADLRQTGVCNVIDVQRVINAVLGGACVVGSQ